MITIAKTFEFCASHRLFREEWSEEQNHNVYGKCANPNGHGHNYRLEVIVGGEIDSVTGMVMDASRLDDIVQQHLFSHVDHRDLNRDVPWLRGKVPTVEVLTEAFWDRLEQPIADAGSGAQLQKLILHETSKIFATKTRPRG
ncbi:6-carboxytetrahydropterin synthase [bacterium]|nr:6-carboxytetrahydropterin synthase [bacterium]